MSEILAEGTALREGREEGGGGGAPSLSVQVHAHRMSKISSSLSNLFNAVAFGNLVRIMRGLVQSVSAAV